MHALTHLPNVLADGSLTGVITILTDRLKNALLAIVALGAAILVAWKAYESKGAPGAIIGAAVVAGLTLFIVNDVPFFQSHVAADVKNSDKTITVPFGHRSLGIGVIELPGHAVTWPERPVR
jgi:hypothetical protein